MDKKLIFAGIAAVLVIGYFIYMGKQYASGSGSNYISPVQTGINDTNTVSGNPPEISTGTQQSDMVSSNPKESTISITSSGINPKILTASMGTKIILTNKSGTDISINSDPHPAHTLYPILNIGVIKDGDSASLTFTKSGIYTYHNHFNPSQKGEIDIN
jgi:plastocyanin